MGTVRVKPTVACVVFDEKTGGFVTLAPNTPFDASDPVAKAHKWAFESDDEASARGEAAGRVISVNMDTWVETATAAPGEKRNIRPTTKAPAEVSHGPITTQSFPTTGKTPKKA